MSERDELKDANSPEAGIDRSPAWYLGKTVGLPRLREKTPEDLEREKNQSKLYEGSLTLEDLRHEHAKRGVVDPCCRPQNPKAQRKGRRINYFETGRKLADLLKSQDKNKLPEINWEELGVVIDQFDQVADNILLAALCGLSPSDRKTLIVDYNLIDHSELEIEYTAADLNQAVARFRILIQSLATYLRAKKLTPDDLFLSSNGNESQETPSQQDETMPDLHEDEHNTRPSASVRESGRDLWLENLPLFSNKSLRMKDFLAGNQHSTEKVCSESQSPSLSIFFWLAWEESGLPLFKSLKKNSTHPPATLNKGKLALSSELIKLLEIECTGGGLKKTGINASLAKIITSLKPREISILYLLGVKKMTLATVMKRVGMHEKYTAGVFVDVKILPILAKLNLQS